MKSLEGKDTELLGHPSSAYLGSFIVALAYFAHVSFCGCHCDKHTDATRIKYMPESIDEICRKPRKLNDNERSLRESSGA